jgi:alpha-beta hydrolase superfamily lysophospholipase
MAYSISSFNARDGKKISFYSWLADNPRAVLQLVHGMMEHSGRYDDFASWMTHNGVSVYSTDNRGHGLTAGTQDNLGYLDKEYGWEKVLGDLHDFTAIISKENPGMPVFLLGHSFGSLLARDYMIRFGDDVSGYIISGTLDQPVWLCRLGVIMAWAIRLFKGDRYRAKVFTDLGYGRYNKAFKPARSEFDWLCSDSEIVDRYLSDPFCGQPSTVSFYKDFFRGNIFAGRVSRIRKVPAHIPIFMFSGQEDVVGNFGKDVEKVRMKFLRAGLINLIVKIYAGGRHEMLNEKSWKKVCSDILEWIPGTHRNIEPDTWID